MGEPHRRACVSRNFRGWLCHPRSPVLNHILKGKAESTQSFYALILNRSRKVRTLKCKWYFLVLTTRSPSDLQITASETLHQLIHWWRTKSQASAWKTSCKLLHGLFTTLIFLQQCLCVTLMFLWSLALGHGGTQLPLGGNEWNLLCLWKPRFLRYGLFGRIVRRWSDGGMQPKLLLSFCSALLSPSMMIQFLCSGWKSTAK